MAIKFGTISHGTLRSEDLPLPNTLVDVQRQTLASYYFAGEIAGFSMHVLHDDRPYPQGGWRVVHAYGCNEVVYHMPEDSLEKAMHCFEDEIARIHRAEVEAHRERNRAAWLNGR